MKVKHIIGEQKWSPFQVILMFETEEETTRFYEALQEEPRNAQLQSLGSYVESCSEDQILQREQSI